VFNTAVRLNPMAKRSARCLARRIMAQQSSIAIKFATLPMETPRSVHSIVTPLKNVFNNAHKVTVSI
jgi:hypothetical protein